MPAPALATVHDASPHDLAHRFASRAGTKTYTGARDLLSLCVGR